MNWTRKLSNVSSSASALEPYKSFTDITVTSPALRVLHVQLNRPDKKNAMRAKTFAEIKACFDAINHDKHFRSVVLSGSGSMFCSGIDLMSFASLGSVAIEDPSRKALVFRQFVTDHQQPIISVYTCCKPVIAAVHGGCVGGGIDLTSACDIRYGSSDSWYQIKEVDLGLAADIGTLQLFPRIVPFNAIVRELIYTGRKFDAKEAEKIGFVAEVLPDQDSVINAAIETASTIANKSPIVVQGLKVNLEYSRDHSVMDGLKFVAVWNGSALQSSDTMKAAMALMSKSKESPEFDDLGESVK